METCSLARLERIRIKRAHLCTASVSPVLSDPPRRMAATLPARCALLARMLHPPALCLAPTAPGALTERPWARLPMLLASRVPSEPFARLEARLWYVCAPVFVHL